MNEVMSFNRTLSECEAEIKVNSELVGMGIWNLGNSFKEIRDSKLYSEKGYSSFEAYIEHESKYGKSHVYSFISVSESYTVQSIGRIAEVGIAKMIELARLPELTRNEFIESHDVEDMTTRELKEAIKERKQVESENLDLKERLRAIESREPITLHKEVYKEPADYLELKQKTLLVDEKDKEIQRLKHEEFKYKLTIKELIQHQKNIISKLPASEQKEKLVNDVWKFVRTINELLKEVGGLVYLTQSINELPEQERNYYERAIENIWAWSNQIKFNLEKEKENE